MKAAQYPIVANEPSPILARMKFVSTVLVVFTGAILLVPISGRSQSRQRLHSEIRNSELRNLVGFTVENLDGEKLGKIKNFVLETPSGTPKYVLISSGGIVNLRPHTRIVPASAVSTATAKKGTALLDVSIKNWAKAPLFKKKDLTLLSDATRYAEIRKFYSHSIEPGASASQKNLTSAGNSTPKQTGNVAKANGPAGPLELATDIVGKNVLSRQNESLGKVSDLVLDVSGKKCAFAIISIDRFLKKDQSYAVPFRSLSSSDTDKLVLDANRKMFEEAPRFDEKAWQSASVGNANAIYRFEIP